MRSEEFEDHLDTFELSSFLKGKLSIEIESAGHLVGNSRRKLNYYFDKLISIRQYVRFCCHDNSRKYIWFNRKKEEKSIRQSFFLALLNKRDKSAAKCNKSAHEGNILVYYLSFI